MSAPTADARPATASDAGVKDLGPRLQREHRAEAARRRPPLAPAVLGRTVDVYPVSGRVLVELPGKAAIAKGSGFKPLTEPRQVPVGSTLDTTGGVVRLVSATVRPGKPQSGDFGAGVFRVLQSSRERGLTRLNLLDTVAPRAVCASAGKLASAARRHLGSRILGRLNAREHGRFVTRGRFSAATVRGTIFSMRDQCDGTFTTVSRGAVLVLDFARRKTVMLQSGQTYLAKATVVSGEASNVAQTTAQLNGTANPNGGEVTSCAFEYGPTVAYGKTALCSALPGSGTTPVPVLVPITGLSAHTPFHFRISATTAAGVSFGEDSFFETLPFAPQVEIGQALHLQPTSAELTATINPNGSQITSCVFEYGATTAYGKIAPCSPPPGSGESTVAVSAAIAGLASNSPVHARVVAVNAGGSSASGDTAFQTPPLRPTIGHAEAIGLTQTAATLSTSIDPNGGQVTACEFEWGTTAEYGETAPCSPSPGSGTEPVTVTASLTGWTPKTPFHFRVLATNAAGTTVDEDHTSATLPEPPTVITEQATEVHETSATLQGAVGPNGGNVTSCEFEYGPTEAYGKTAPCTPTPDGGEGLVHVSATATGLNPTSTFQFRLVATNAGGTSKGADRALNTPPSELELLVPEPETSLHSFITATVFVTEAPFVGQTVKFTVTGANPQEGEAITNEEGEATFTYSGENAGTDHIIASFTNEEGITFKSGVTTTWAEFGVTVPPPIELSGRHGAIFGAQPAPPLSESITRVAAVGEVKGAVIGARVSGVVLVKPPRSGARPKPRTTPLTEPAAIPLGSEIRAGRGVVALATSARASYGAGGFTIKQARASGEFGAGSFTVRQDRDSGGVTELGILDARPRGPGCAATGEASAAGESPSTEVLGRLNASYQGKMRVRGRFSTASALGRATFSVGDRCDGTFTVVTRGRVSVHDLVTGRTVALGAGRALLAKAP